MRTYKVLTRFYGLWRFLSYNIDIINAPGRSRTHNSGIAIRRYIQFNYGSSNLTRSDHRRPRKEKRR